MDGEVEEVDDEYGEKMTGTKSTKILTETEWHVVILSSLARGLTDIRREFTIRLQSCALAEFIAVAETAVMSADDASAQGKGEGELWTRLQATKAGLDKLVKFFGEQSSPMHQTS